MYLAIRRLLPWLVAAAWVWVSARIVLGEVSGRTLRRVLRTRELDNRWADWELLAWFLAMLGAMVLVDRAWCAFARWRVGVDPRTVHWSLLRNADGGFICAHCHSIFMLPPPDLADEGFVRCGDCGHPKAPWGEMKPALRGYAGAGEGGPATS